jgi:hypothetical protein
MTAVPAPIRTFFSLARRVVVDTQHIDGRQRFLYWRAIRRVRISVRYTGPHRSNHCVKSPSWHLPTANHFQLMTGASPTPPPMTPEPQPTTPHRQQIALHQTGCRFIQGLAGTGVARASYQIRPARGGWPLFIWGLQVLRPAFTSYKAGGCRRGAPQPQPATAACNPVASLQLAIQFATHQDPGCLCLGGKRQTANQNHKPSSGR